MAGKIIVKSETEMRRWFENNFEKVGYSKILDKTFGQFPDFLMLKNGKEVKVELETCASHFNLHKHDAKKVDEVVCIENDEILGIPVIEVKELSYGPRIRRISATIDKELAKKITEIVMNNKSYRNKSHFIEKAIEKFAEEESKQK